MPVLAGALSVIIAGVRLRVTSPVISWVSLEQTRHVVRLTLDKEVVRYCLMKFNALVMNHTYGIAATLDGIQNTVAIMKMWVLNVTNTSFMQQPVISLDIKFWIRIFGFNFRCLCEFY